MYTVNMCINEEGNAFFFKSNICVYGWGISRTFDEEDGNHCENNLKEAHKRWRRKII